MLNEINKKRLAITAFSILMATSIAACNTVEGFGKDVEKTGEKIEDSSDKDRTDHNNH